MNDGQSSCGSFFESNDIKVIGTRFGRDEKIAAAIHGNIYSGNFGNRRGKSDRRHAIAGFDIKFIDLSLIKTEFPELVDCFDFFR